MWFKKGLRSEGVLTAAWCLFFPGGGFQRTPLVTVTTVRETPWNYFHNERLQYIIRPPFPLEWTEEIAAAASGLVSCLSVQCTCIVVL
jgi:hypothetical protein